MPNSFSEYTSDGQNYYFPQCPKTPHFIVFQLWIRFGRVCVSLLLVSVSSSAFPLYAVLWKIHDGQMMDDDNIFTLFFPKHVFSHGNEKD